MSAKLQLRSASDNQGQAFALTKQSFGDKCVPKLELGNEGKAARALFADNRALPGERMNNSTLPLVGM